jgi:non-specific serine/threonine protein kinase/serine/threonine-protein kinase
MGQVWLAKQTAPVKRQVALKLIKGGIFGSSALQRFQSERQTLAIMDHPSIAKVFDAGATPAGQPYFVMEYVPGVPITAYCDQKKLKISERLELFIKVCEAIQHAHQKAIIHRDLKPANILVVEVDGKPLPRIIDFGLAKAISAEALGQDRFTREGSFLGTPGYMSPEQADPGGLDVDTRTDVYTLGAVLYVLLTGSLPFESEERRNRPLHEILRQLREDDPPRPSTKASTRTDSTKTAAEARGTEPKQLLSLLRGDLDWITMKALERDRARRYATPTELAADLRRYLRHEPVVAVPARVSYRLQKYVRRHRIGVVAAAVVTGLLISFGVVQAGQLRRITRERDRANRITAFMTDMFRVSDPSEARGNSITAREVLDKASKQIDTGLAKDPEAQAQMMNVMGSVYMSLGLYRRARPLLEQALDIRRRVLGPENSESLSSASLLGSALDQDGDDAQAETLLRHTLAIQRRVLGREHPDTLMSMNYLAGALRTQHRFEEAENLYREALQIRRRVLGPEHRDTLISMENLAGQLSQEGRYTEAEVVTRESLEIRRRLFGVEHPDTLDSMLTLNWELLGEGRYSEAEKLVRETLATSQRVLGPEHPRTLWSMNNLAVTLEREGRYPEAEKVQREARAIQQRVLGPEHPDTALSTYNLGCFAARQGHRQQALLFLREAVDHGLRPDNSLGMDKDPDLKSLHGDPRFAALVAHAKELAAAQKPN